MSSALPANPRRQAVRKPRIGLIGGIGSGKSLVAAELGRAGGRIISADALGHEALHQPAIRDRLVARWGRSILDERGVIARRIVGGIVFPDAGERRFLESIVFPYIEQRVREEAAAGEGDANARFLVLDAAIMLEAGWSDVCEWLVYVHAPRAMRLERLVRQRGWSAKEVEARENAQWPLTDKVSRAHFVIDNSFAREHTVQQVQNLVKLWDLQRE